jgi:hypothetical protein
MKQFESGGFGVYEYDIARGQHQALSAGQSYTENNFQIMPYARLVYILFLPDHATFPIDNRRRPISALSRFPSRCTQIRLSFAGEGSLVTHSFENFGVAGEDHQMTKKVYYEYLRSNGMTNDKFEDFFPTDPDEVSLIQGFVVDLKSLYSNKTEILSVKCEFAANQVSPPNQQIVCLSVHPNGRAICKSGGSLFNYIWQFTQPI